MENPLDFLKKAVQEQTRKFLLQVLEM